MSQPGHRAVPPVPNVVSGYGVVPEVPVEPPKRRRRLTIRTAPPLNDRVPDLEDRLIRYRERCASGDGYRLRTPKVTQTVVLDADLHDFLHSEAKRLGVTANRLIAKILSDSTLDPTWEPDAVRKDREVQAGTWIAAGYDPYPDPAASTWPISLTWPASNKHVVNLKGRIVWKDPPPDPPPTP